ncbi:MAG: hypothetical protein ACE5GG_02420 [Candidatus Omnitrophota bacterium]
MVGERVYFLLGNNPSARLAKLEEIKREVLSCGDVADFNRENLDARGLTPDALQEGLLRLPVSGLNDALSRDKRHNAGHSRLLVIRGVEGLSLPCRKVIGDYLSNPSRDMVVVLEGGSYPDKTIKQVKPGVRVLVFDGPRPANAFSLCRAIKAGNRASALNILGELLLNGEKPEKILGAVIWQWGQRHNYFPQSKTRKGLRVILDTDLNIKSGRFKADIALELLVVKLTLLT